MVGALVGGLRCGSERVAWRTPLRRKEESRRGNSGEGLPGWKDEVIGIGWCGTRHPEGGGDGTRLRGEALGSREQEIQLHTPGGGEQPVASLCEAAIPDFADSRFSYTESACLRSKHLFSVIFQEAVRPSFLLACQSPS